MDRVKSLLRQRFGNNNQAERFRAELRCLKRRPGDSLQWLYQEVCRLMSLAYPDDPASKTSKIVGRDAFLDALENPDLRVKILEREPCDLDEALNNAMRFEAYAQGFEKEVAKSRDVWTPKGKFVKTVQGISS